MVFAEPSSFRGPRHSGFVERAGDCALRLKDCAGCSLLEQWIDASACFVNGICIASLPKRRRRQKCTIHKTILTDREAYPDMSNDPLTKEAEVSADCEYPDIEYCKHPDMEYLGENSGAMFLRCEACSKVYVLQDGRVWAIPTVARNPAA